MYHGRDPNFPWHVESFIFGKQNIYFSEDMVGTIQNIGNILRNFDRAFMRLERLLGLNLPKPIYV